MPKRAAPGENPSNHLDIASSDLSSSSNQKSIKAEHQTPDDFSNSVKKKLAGSSRTGQACDRCKVRKIRCDGKPGGCSPCAQNNTACKTTDRITGRATTRGHTEYLEQQNDNLRSHIAQLESQLRSLGVDFKPLPPQHGYVPPPAEQTQATAWPPATPNGDIQSWAGVPSYNPKPLGANSTPQDPDLTMIRSALPAFKTGCIGDNYLGVSSPDSLLSPIKGLSLSIFGAELDLGEFIAEDRTESASLLSYERFLQVIFNRVDNIEKLPWPPASEVEQFTTWYFRSMHPYCPLLHQPAFLDLIWRIYNEPGFQPSSAQIVIVHMVLAIMKHQIAARNSVETFYADSHKHYLYSLTFYSELLMGHTLENIQALALICCHIRNSAKPGAAWMVTTSVFVNAIELGLHRSSSAWADTAPQRSEVEIELRKRVFWVLYQLLVGLNGRLGRPMPIRLEDFDVELPKAINDCGQGTQMEHFHDCSFQIGLLSPGIAIIIAEMYSTIYAVKQSPQSYEQVVRKLEQDIKRWRDQIPPELSLDSNPDFEDAIFVRYLQFWEHDTQLLLHHPSLCRSNSPEFISRNMDICLNASKRMLEIVEIFRKLRVIDLTWMHVTSYVAAIFTTLYIHSQRKDQMSSIDLISLRNDMDQWLEIMKDVGFYFGTGPRLHIALQKIIEQSLEGIGGHVVKRTATAAVAQSTPLHPSSHPAVSPTVNGYGVSGTFPPAYGGTSPITNGLGSTKPTGFVSGGEASIGTSSNGFQSGQYQYQDKSNQAYQPTVAPGFDTAAYQSSVADASSLTPEQAAQAAAQAAAAATVAVSGTTPSAHTNGYIYANNTISSTAQPSPYQSHSAIPTPNHNATWREWTQQMIMSTMSPGSYMPTAVTASSPQHTRMSSANALMALGGTSSAVGDVGQAPNANSVKVQDWPHVMFNYRPSGEQ